MREISKNSVGIAGEFAVLSKLALAGYIANLTLGQTKSVDILVADPRTDRMIQLEVKTRLVDRIKPENSTLFGAVYKWPMDKKHETICNPNLFYCFVLLSKKEEQAPKFYILPSKVVAGYVTRSHRYWLEVDKSHKDSSMRGLLLGVGEGAYKIETPLAKDYENNWDFKS